MLALEAALAGVPGVASLVLTNTPASMPLWAAETSRLRRKLPDKAQAVLDANEQTETTNSADYQEAMMVFYQRHICRLNTWPDCLLHFFTAMERDSATHACDRW